MPTVISHGVAAVAIQKVFMAERLPPRFWLLSIGCAMLPDIDVVGFTFGIRYGDMLGHRGLTHSLPFALVVACAAAWFALQAAPQLTTRWLVLV
jgi:inner membrane protein